MHAILETVISICCAIGTLFIVLSVRYEGIALNYLAGTCYFAALILEVILSFHQCDLMDLVNVLLYVVVLYMTRAAIRRKQELLQASEQKEPDEQPQGGNHEPDQHHP